MPSDVEVVITEGYQTLRLTRAHKKNALTNAMYHTLADALASGEESSGVAAHIVLGSGGIFSAGNDIGDFLATARG